MRDNLRITYHVARSRNVYTSSAILTVWCYFGPEDRFDGCLMPPATISRT